MDTQETNLSLAILIDADNASPSIISNLLLEVAKFGVASVKRIYGDWTSDRLGSWKQVLLEHSIQPIQQFSYTTGKNATDSAMIIDAMDLLYAEKVTGFCLVSSDSDFTKLAVRLRESGRMVLGFGEQKTPKPFVSACDRFIYTEIFNYKIETQPNDLTSKRTSKELRGDGKLTNLVRSAIEVHSDEEGWADLGPIGSFIRKASNDFDVRNYGYTKLSELIKMIGLFEIKAKDKQIFVRNPKKKPKAE